MRSVIVVAVIAIPVVLFELLPLTYLVVAPKDGVVQIVVQEEEGGGRWNDNKNFYQALEDEHEDMVAVLFVGIGEGVVIGNNSVRMRDSISSADSKNKLVHSSFRIEEGVMRALAKAAEKEGMTLSSLVNKTLKNYVTSEMHFEELGFILVSKNFLRNTFEALDDKHVEELGKEYGFTIAKEYFSYFYTEVNSSTLIEFLEKILFRRFQSSQHRVDDTNKNRHYFTVNHDIDMNFSLVLQSVLEALIEPIIKSTVEFENVTPNAITFSFKVS